MSLTISAVPESVSWDRFQSWLAEFGIDTSQCRCLYVDRNGLKAEVFALDQDGRRYVQPGADELATHTVQIQITPA